MKKARDNLQHITITAESGAGLVKSTVKGQRKLIKIGSMIPLRALTTVTWGTTY
ncbi:YbaB/EbfC family nucleoid-associated protein [Pontibacter virosus]|uniref:YbaB/EbfC family nucleoid-associated protein n=1 Tax=Pontibacter virosus TaxID=1765052 RepID=UPI001057B8EC|nr:YbaB/EbfC family nucleoid-associated protein [Pontibacter virosus]